MLIRDPFPEREGRESRIVQRSWTVWQPEPPEWSNASQSHPKLNQSGQIFICHPHSVPEAGCPEDTISVRQLWRHLQQETAVRPLAAGSEAPFLKGDLGAQPWIYHSLPTGMFKFTCPNTFRIWTLPEFRWNNLPKRKFKRQLCVLYNFFI